jgi:hypothetical protein
MRAPLAAAAFGLVALCGLSPRLDARQPGDGLALNANYRLEATLDPASRTITGRGRLIWRNTARIPATELRFHLYWNAWRNEDSSWMREQWLGRTPALASRPAEDRASIDLTVLTRAGAEGAAQDLRRAAHFIAPDDGNMDDRTVLAVPLDRAVAPGATIEIDLAWTSRVPRTFDRTGAIGDYFFIAQWFPKIGVFENTGWNCHQFHAATEFFADFGRYDVTLTVPSGWVVGATGRGDPPADGPNGVTSHRYVADAVHDFAWTTSPAFLDLHDQFTEPGLPPVEMRLLLQPEHASQAARHFEATRVALRAYGTWFGPYPYGHITIVDPVTIVNAATQGGSTGGMEYPTLFTAGTRWIAPANGLSPEGVTVHEAGHQFWYGLVATNEFEHAWMDEGFNTFATARAIDEFYPPRFVTVERYFGGFVGWAYADARWSRDVDGNRLNAYRPVAASDVQSTPTWRYWPGTASPMSYNKTALWLATLERHLGWPTLQRILATHFARGAFRHPTPAQFFAIANEVSGQDLTWFFDAVHRSNAVFDYAIAQVTSLPQSPAGDIASTVVVRRLGTGIFPVSVRVVFADGSEAREAWDGRDPWRAFTFRKPARVASAVVDPDRMLLLDVNVTNNSWTAAPRGPAAARRWSLRWLTWLQEVLLTYAVFI